MMRNGSVALVVALALGACASESDPDERVAQASEVEATQDESSEGEEHEQVGNAGATDGEQGRDESARDPQSDASTEADVPDTTGDDEPARDSVVDDEAPVDGKTEQAVQDEPASDDTQGGDAPTSTDEADDAPDGVNPDGVNPDGAESDAAAAAIEDAGTGEIASELQEPDAAPSTPSIDAVAASELSCNALTALKAEFTDAVAEVEHDFSECVYDDECVIFRAEYFSCPAPNDWLLLVGGRSYALSSMQTEAFQSVFDELAGEACPDSPHAQPSCPGATGAGTVELAACVAGSCAKVISGSNQGNPRPL